MNRLRALLTCCILLSSSAGSALAAGKSPEALIQGLQSVRSATYEFVQFSPRGEQVTGTMKLERPGRVRFEYEGKSALLVLADGRSLAINNRKLKTWNLYPLDKTPLKFLLDSSFDEKKVRIISSDVSGNITSIVLTDPSVFGDAKIRLVFDNVEGTLKQWTVTDSANKETTVLLYNGKTGMSFSKADFSIPYTEIRTGNKD